MTGFPAMGVLRPPDSVEQAPTRPHAQVTTRACRDDFMPTSEDSHPTVASLETCRHFGPTSLIGVVRERFNCKTQRVVKPSWSEKEGLKRTMDHPKTPFVVVIDFEATCGDGVAAHEIEIIEFAAILADANFTPHEDGEFCRFTRPVLHPILSTFCRELTTIAQNEVD